MSGAGAEKLGEGLMQIGGNYINLTQKDLENKVEVIKQKTLSDMHSQEQYMKGTIAFAGLESEAEGRRIQQEQFKTTTDIGEKQFKQEFGLKKDAHTLAQEALDRETEHKEEVRALSRATLEATISTADKNRAFQKYKINMTHGTLSAAGQAQLKLDRDRLEEVRRAHKVAEGDTKARIAIELRAMEANMAAVLDQLALARLKHRDNMTISERTRDHVEKIDDINAKISQGRLDLAGDQLKVEKARFLKEFGLKEDKFNYDKSHTNRSFFEQRRQWNQSHSLKSSELKVVQERLKLAQKDQADTKILNVRAATLKDDILDLDREKLKLEGTRVAQEVLYKEIMGQVATRGIKIDEAKLQIDETASKRGQWKATTRDVYERVATTDPITNATTYEDVKVGEEIVYVNIDDEGLHDVRILQNDGTWMFGSPDGANKDHQVIIKAIDLAMKRQKELGKTVSFKDARDEIQAMWQSGELFKGEAYKQRDWDRFMNALLIVPSEKRGVTTAAGGVVTTPAAGGTTTVNADGTVSTPSNSLPEPNALGVDQHGNPYEVGDHVKGKGYVVKVDHQLQRHGMGAYTKKYIYAYSDESPETEPVAVPSKAAAEKVEPAATDNNKTVVQTPAVKKPATTETKKEPTAEDKAEAAAARYDKAKAKSETAAKDAENTSGKGKEAADAKAAAAEKAATIAEAQANLTVKREADRIVTAIIDGESTVDVIDTLPPKTAKEVVRLLEENVKVAGKHTVSHPKDIKEAKAWQIHGGNYPLSAKTASQIKGRLDYSSEEAAVHIEGVIVGMTEDGHNKQSIKIHLVMMYREIPDNKINSQYAKELSKAYDKYKG